MDQLSWEITVNESERLKTVWVWTMKWNDEWTYDINGIYANNYIE